LRHTEVDNVDVTAAIVLDDLIGSLVGTATDNVGGSATLDRDGILTNILEPDELQVARAETMNALFLVGADNDVAKSCTVLEDKDCILLTYQVSIYHRLESCTRELAKLTTFALTRALDTAVVANPFSVENLTLLEISGCAEGLGASGFGNTACVAKACHGGGKGGKNSQNARSVHLD
jgi:hypothetical protein